MMDSEAAELVAKFERAILDAAHLQLAYREARLVAGTNEALTGLFNAAEDADAKRSRMRLKVLEALSMWRPIDTAPTDGRCIVVYATARDGLNEMVSLCSYHPDAGFCIDELREPTHWALFNRPKHSIPPKQ